MRSYCSLYIDAGYLTATASTRVAGTSLRRAAQIDVPELLTDLTSQVEADSGLPLLRIHWFDAGTRAGGPSVEQREIAKLPQVKLRLGRLGYDGEQKGVDLKLALDLIAQSRNRAAEIVYLVSGDDDLSEAVEEAQVLGVQVVALVMPDVDGTPIGFSQHLHQTVDRVMLIDAGVLALRVRKSPAASMAEVAAAARASEPVPDPAVATVTPVEVPVAPPGQPAPVAALTRAPTPVPTPLAIPRARPLAVPDPVPAPVPAAPVRSATAYSTTTGVGGRWIAGADHVDMSEEIEAVVEAVVQAWLGSAPPNARAELMRDKPIIPAEIDRALLRDLSDRTDVWDIPVDARFALRQAFWAHIERL